jgi:hypothetical protein
LKAKERDALLAVLKDRFEKNMKRHKGIEWTAVQAKLEAASKKLDSINAMETTGGEPDVIGLDKASGEFIFCDCSAESPEGRRSYCYDADALAARKENKPAHSAVAAAAEMGIELLTEEQYRELHKLGKFDLKTSSWLNTPAEIRKLGGAIFGDFRYGTIFIYHNGVQSYYAGRGFRGMLKV